MTEITLEAYKQLIEMQGRQLLGVVRSVAMGDLDVSFEIPEGVPVFTDLAVGIGMLIDDIRDMYAAREQARLVEAQSRALLAVVQSVALGDFDVAVVMPEGVEELSELGVGIEMMLDDIRAMLDAQAQNQAEVEASKHQLEEALEEMRATQRRYVQQEWTDYAAARSAYIYAEGMDEPQPVVGDTPALWSVALAEAVEKDATVIEEDVATGQMLALPVSWAGETIGVLGFIRQSMQSWEPDEIAAVEEIVEQAGWALENQRLFDETQRARALLSKQIRELDCLNDIGRKIAESPTIPELLQWTAERIPAAMQYTDVCIAAIEYAGRFHGNIEAIDMTRQMVNGLRIGDAQVGRAVVAYTADYAFLDGESALLGDIARRLTGYIENRQLLEQTEARAVHEQALFEIAGAIGSSEDMEDVLAALPAIVAPLRRLAPVDVLSIATYNSGESVLTLFAVPLETAEAHFSPLGTRLPLEGSAPGWVVTHKKPWREADMRRKLTFAEDPNLIAEGVVARLLLPLQFGDQLIGTLNLGSRQPGAFTQDHVTILGQVANQLAQAMERARLLQSTRAALDAEAETRRSYERREWQTYLQENRKLRQNTFVYNQGQVDVLPDFWRPEMLRSLREVTLATTHDAAAEVAVSAEAPDAAAEEKRVGLAIPIEMRGQVIGVLGVEDPQGVWRVSADQLALIQSVAQQLGQALESARLLEATQRRAAREQRTREITDNIRAAPTIEDAVKRAVQEIARVLNASEMVARLGSENLLTSREEGEAYE